MNWQAVVGCYEEVGDLSMTEYSDVKGQFVNVLDSSDDNEEMKRGFLMKNRE